MKVGELRFILNDSNHHYEVDGVFQLESDDYVTKRAVIKLESDFEMLPFPSGNIDVTVAIDEDFIFECTRVDLVDAKTIELVITRTLVA